MIKNLVIKTIVTAIIALGVTISAYASTEAPAPEYQKIQVMRDGQLVEVYMPPIIITPDNPFFPTRVFTAEDATADPDITIMVDGKIVELDVPPQIVNDVTLVPLRAMFEAFSVEIEWNAETQEISIPFSPNTTREGHTIITIGDEIPRRVGPEISPGSIGGRLEVAPMIIEDRVMVPLTFVSGNRGKSLAWDEETKTAYLGYDPRTLFTPEQAREFELEVFRLTNLEREKAGLAPCIWDEDLARAARKHAEELSIHNRLPKDHSGIDGSTPEERVARETDRFGYVGENAHATTGGTPESVVRSWMRSPGHRAQILSNVDRFDRDHYLGVGFSNIDGRVRVVQKFSSIAR